jgi:hypothetical protein
MGGSLKWGQLHAGAINLARVGCMQWYPHRSSFVTSITIFLLRLWNRIAVLLAGRFYYTIGQKEGNLTQTKINNFHVLTSPLRRNFHADFKNDLETSSAIVGGTEFWDLNYGGK